MTTADLHEAPFVRVRVPGYLTRSLQLALAEVHAPFFSMRQQDDFLVALREDEWGRIAARFPMAQVERGLRLISVDQPEGDPAVPKRLEAALAEAGIEAAVLPAFHRDHLLVPAALAETCLAVVRQVVGRRS